MEIDVIDSDLTPTGIPHGLQGVRFVPEGLVPRPAESTLLGWRQLPQVPGPQRLWLLGAHGGAGVSAAVRTFAAAGCVAGDVGRAWPVPNGRPVLVVARTHGRGRSAAVAAARQHHSGYTPPGTELAGCLLIPDGPGRLPKAMVSEIVGQVSGVFPRTWVLPWVEAYRLADPVTDEHWATPPGDAVDLITRIEHDTSGPSYEGAQSA
ncbi:MAG: hypothetical protein JWN95_1357 [Frankiales bacterium]|nr:hypothetical protein [Frankiales bacterium]